MSIAADQQAGNAADEQYSHYLQQLQARFLERLKTFGPILFTTDAAGLYEAYLSAFPTPEEKQYHNCHECRRFIETYGGLVVIDDMSGLTIPAVWYADDAPFHYLEAIHKMQQIVSRAKVTGVFYSSEKKWGMPITGEWSHLALIPPKELIYRHTLMTAYQAMAEKKQDFQMLRRALADFSPAVVSQALTLLRTESLYRSEKCLGVAEALARLHQAIAAAAKHRSDCIIWRAVATAPTGFCHVRSSMIGTLLEDIAAGLPFADVAKRFADKMDPMKYMRPQAPPSAGNIAQGEKIVEKMGIAASLRRRFARLEELNALWKPAPAAPPAAPAGGVFGHLQAKGAAPAVVGGHGMRPVRMTWEKFARVVLPAAEKIEYRVPKTRENYSAIVTAADPEAPPIYQWDSEEHRNPFSQYVYRGGSMPSTFNLEGGSLATVTAVCYQPSMWNGGHDHQGASVFFILEDCHDTNAARAGLGIFPESLRSELHSIRATIEAFSNAGVIEGADDASACGIRLQKGQEWAAVFRVTSAGSTVEYVLDRWD